MILNLELERVHRLETMAMLKVVGTVLVMVRELGSLLKHPLVKQLPMSHRHKIPKPPRKGKKKGFVSLEDCIEYTKELEENGFFTDNAVTSINIPRKTMKLTSSLAKSLDNVAHYQLVTGILMKILSDNREEVEKIIKEMAEKNTEGLF